jgi:hypothetical protein
MALIVMVCISFKDGNTNHHLTPHAAPAVSDDEDNMPRSHAMPCGSCLSVTVLRMLR